MVDFLPFRGWKPPSGGLETVACRPYDVVNQAEAEEIIKSNPQSLMRVIRPDATLGLSTEPNVGDEYSVASAQFEEMLNEKLFVQDKNPSFYVYAQQMGEHRQIGLMGLVSTQDYKLDRIKKHEFTRPEKEDDRVRHILAVRAHLGPVFLSYRNVLAIDEMIECITAVDAHEKFIADDGVIHELWSVDDSDLCEKIQSHFESVSAFYIADGHHRAAAGSRVGDHEGCDGQFLAVAFADNALQILPYNRHVLDLNDLSTVDFMAALRKNFSVEPMEGAAPPESPKQFSMYIDKAWYRVAASKAVIEGRPDNTVAALDVSLLQDVVLSPLLAIDDPRTSKRINFVGGIRGLSYLAESVDRLGGVAFSLYPTSMDELLAVADSGDVMPPKSTWFEPKLRTGLVINRF